MVGRTDRKNVQKAACGLGREGEVDPSRRFSLIHTDREPQTGYPEGNAVSFSNT